MPRLSEILASNLTHPTSILKGWSYRFGTKLTASRCPIK